MDANEKHREEEKAAGHHAIAIHQRYVILTPRDVAKAFGIIEDYSHIIRKEHPAKLAASGNS